MWLRVLIGFPQKQMLRQGLGVSGFFGRGPRKHRQKQADRKGKGGPPIQGCSWALYQPEQLGLFSNGTLEILRAHTSAFKLATKRQGSWTVTHQLLEHELQHTRPAPPCSQKGPRWTDRRRCGRGSPRLVNCRGPRVKTAPAGLGPLASQGPCGPR